MPETPEMPAGPRIEAQPATAFNYAAWLNDFPLLRQLSIDNSNGPDLADVTVKFEAKPPFARPRAWHIDLVRAGEVYTLADHHVEIDADFMERLNEADRGQLLFRLLRGEEELAFACRELRVLARDEWGGATKMAELLPAFVTPNESAIADLQREAAEILGNQPRPMALTGYQSGDRQQVWRQTAALWSAIYHRNVAYSNPPSSYERLGQKIRRASQILDSKLATCLDMAVLFASSLEAIGLNPILVLQQEHAFAGVWLEDKTFEQPLENDCGELRKAVQAEELIVFETTLATHPGTADFDKARAKAFEAIGESQEHKFQVAVDIKRSRIANIKPLASRESANSRSSGESLTLDGELRVPEIPSAPEFKRPGSAASSSSLESPAETPLTPVERIENWKRKLLDLTLRNRLLNFRPTQQTVPIASIEPSLLEDQLADGASLELKCLEMPATGRGAEASPSLTLQQEREFAKLALKKRALLCSLGHDEFAKRLTTLRRKVANDQAEGGANTLYLAIGFLRWRETADDPRAFRAPLLLLPVQLSQPAARAAFRLAKTDDEPRFNATLAEKLKRDFGVDLSALVAKLPSDDTGVDVPRLLEEVRIAVRGLRGVEVVEETVLASFSFTKYLMWKDLSERVGTIERNRVVAHLVNRHGQRFPDAPTAPLPVASELDKRYRPEQIVHPLPADSSQLAAVMAADEGRDFVIVGPPGTGKSQTIANLIAQCVARGKTVLFVAEKAAALNVVYRRLKEHQLADRCVELHSHKTGRKHFLEQLKRAWQSRGHLDLREWNEAVRDVAVLRDKLNEYAEALHQPAENGWTPLRALGESSLRRGAEIPKLPWPASPRHTESDYNARRDAVRRLVDAYSALPGGELLPMVRQREWSMAWENELVQTCERLAAAATQLKEAYTSFAPLIDISHRDDIPFDLHKPLEDLSSHLANADARLRELLSFDGLESLAEKLKQREALLATADHARQTLVESANRLLHAIGGTTRDFSAGRLHGAGGAGSPGELGSPSDIAGLEGLERLVAELTRSALPPAELALHDRFEALLETIAMRPRLLKDRTEALDRLRDRGFSPTLIERIPVDRMELEWQRASGAVWPLSWWQTNKLKKKLKPYMRPGREPDLEIDISVLVDYRTAVRDLANNLDSLGLPPPLRQSVELSPDSLDESLAAARRLREVVRSAGGAIEQLGRLHAGSLRPVIDAASQFATARVSLLALEKSLADNLASLPLPSVMRSSVQSDFTGFKQSLDVALAIRKSLRSLAGEAAFGPASQRSLNRLLVEPQKSLPAAAKKFVLAMRALKIAWNEYTAQTQSAPIGRKSITLAADVAAQARRLMRDRAALRSTVDWNAAEQQAQDLNLKAFADDLLAKKLPPQEAVARFELAYANWWLPHIIDERPPLRNFQLARHERTIHEFRDADKRARAAAPLRVLWQQAEELPAIDALPRGSDLQELRRQINDGRPRKSIRALIESMPTMFPLLAPCLLMSPLSIAQYLPANLRQFDVVVFDEASQITTWDAIGAIARGNQTIVVGDPNQLPPTSFFERSDDGDEDGDAVETLRDMPSILDELITDGLPTVKLTWHYRSQHESLIAFSNRQYYDNALATFPAADNRDRGVSFVHVADAVYDRGRTRTNLREAEAIVADLIARMTGCLRQPEERRLTYGVVTFNKQQQDLIEDLLDEARRQQPELEWFFAEERFEPTMVKNLENVQGDERDVMLFSITFGFDAKGAFPVDFGALNREGGHRRLNVAVTRARRTLAVYASFLPDQLQAARSNARGVRDLRAFLEYAQRGATSFASRDTASPTTRDGQLEESIAKALAAHGWTVKQRVGMSDFRVDIGVVHPDKPDAFLAGVECDGRRYVRSAVARDRDITRGVVLASLGWRILPIWSIDWCYSSERAKELDSRLQSLLRHDRETRATQTVESVTTPVIDSLNASLIVAPVTRTVSTPTASSAPEMPENNAAEDSPMRSAVLEETLSWYEPLVFEDGFINKDQFHKPEYTDTLREIVRKVILVHGPIHEEVLVREVKDLHGFQRVGNNIRTRVLGLVKRAIRSKETVGQFFWPTGVPEFIPFRHPRPGAERRDVSEIPIQELVGLALELNSLATSSDPPRTLAEKLGIERLTQAVRERLMLAIERARTLGGKASPPRTDGAGGVE